MTSERGDISWLRHRISRARSRARAPLHSCRTKVTVRPARAPDTYLTDPDKAWPDQHVTDVHDGVFANVNRMPADHTTDVAATGALLPWAHQTLRHTYRDVRAVACRLLSDKRHDGRVFGT